MKEIISKLKKKGKSKNKPDSAYNPRELEMGIKIEMEHGLGKDAAKEIAKDHLEEDPHYYTSPPTKKEFAKEGLKKSTYTRYIKRVGLPKHYRYFYKVTGPTPRYKIVKLGDVSPGERVHIKNKPGSWIYKGKTKEGMHVLERTIKFGQDDRIILNNGGLKVLTERIEKSINLDKALELRMNKALPTTPGKNKPLERGAHRTPPKGYPSEKSQYAIPSEYKYPLDTEKHVRAAMAYFSKAKNSGRYSSEEQRSIWRRILHAAKKMGIKAAKETKEEVKKAIFSCMTPLQKAKYLKRKMQFL